MKNESESSQKEQLIILDPDHDKERLHTKIEQLLYALETVNEAVDKTNDLTEYCIYIANR